MGNKIIRLGAGKTFNGQYLALYSHALQYSFTYLLAKANEPLYSI